MLTVDELRKHVSTALEDDALQRLLDAASEDIAQYAAPSERISPVGDALPLSAPAAAVSEVIEAGTTLNPDDYELVGQLLYRLNTGTNPRSVWHAPVKVTYTRRFTDATREVVQIALVQMDLNYQPGTEQTTIGSFNEMFVNDYRTERRRILSRLNGDAFVWPT